MSSPKPVTMTSSQAQEPLPDDVRKAIYEALLQGRGVPNIEETLSHQMQVTGFSANLRAYINHLLRNEQIATFQGIYDRVTAKVEHDTQAARSKDATNGVNGVNGHSNEGDDYNLALPVSVTTEGTKTVMKELNKVCEITPNEKEGPGEAEPSGTATRPKKVAPTIHLKNMQSTSKDNEPEEKSKSPPKPKGLTIHIKNIQSTPNKNEDPARTDEKPKISPKPKDTQTINLKNIQSTLNENPKDSQQAKDKPKSTPKPKENRKILPKPEENLSKPKGPPGEASNPRKC